MTIASLETAACQPEVEPCDATLGLENAPSSVQLVEGGRGVLVVPAVPAPEDANATWTVNVGIDELAPGFLARRRDDGAILVTAPYGVAGTLPARLVSTCDDGSDVVTKPIAIEVAPLSVQQLAPVPPPFTGVTPSPSPSPGIAATARGIVVAGGGAWALDRSGDGAASAFSSTWRTIDQAFTREAVRAASFDDDHALLMNASGDIALLDVAAGVVSALSASGNVPNESAGASLLHRDERGFALCGRAAGDDVENNAHCRVASLVDGAWSIIEPKGFAPVGRTFAVVDVDAEGGSGPNGRLVLFGGDRDDGPAVDSWSLDVDGKAWMHLGKEEATPPLPRSGACGAVDPVGRRFFVLGGFGVTEEDFDSDEPEELKDKEERGLIVLDLDRNPEGEQDTSWREITVPGMGTMASCSATYDVVSGNIVYLSEDGLFALRVAP